MTRQSRFVVLSVAAVIAVAGALQVNAVAAPQRGAAVKPSLAGRWTLSVPRSQFPTDLGFGMDLVPASSNTDSDADSGGRGGSRGGQSRAFVPRQETEEEARNVKQLIEEARVPSAHLTIEQSDSLVTITDEQGRARRFHTDGRTDYQPLDAQPVASTAKWEGTQLVLNYKVEEGREVRYSYSRKLDPPQLVVQIQFVERNGRGVITRIYEPWRADEPAVVIPTQKASAPASTGWVPAPQPAAPPSAAQPTSPLRDAVKGLEPGRTPPPAAQPGQQMMPAVPGATDAPIGSQRPDAELRGLSRLGIVVEGLDSTAATCGLKSEAIESAVSKSLADGGLKVVLNTDEDTYLYVNIRTFTMGPGTCVSRYDATIYTHTMAKLSYGTAPVLVEVSLLRKAGIIGGPANQHGANVISALKQYVDGFASRVRDANK